MKHLSFIDVEILFSMFHEQCDLHVATAATHSSVVIHDDGAFEKRVNLLLPPKKQTNTVQYFDTCSLYHVFSHVLFSMFPFQYCSS